MTAKKPMPVWKEWPLLHQKAPWRERVRMNLVNLWDQMNIWGR